MEEVQPLPPPTLKWKKKLLRFAGCDHVPSSPEMQRRRLGFLPPQHHATPSAAGTHTELQTDGGLTPWAPRRLPWRVSPPPRVWPRRHIFNAASLRTPWAGLATLSLLRGGPLRWGRRWRRGRLHHSHPTRRWGHATSARPYRGCWPCMKTTVKYISYTGLAGGEAEMHWPSASWWRSAGRNTPQVT
jgi:hypothetical protein